MPNSVGEGAGGGALEMAKSVPLLGALIKWLLGEDKEGKNAGGGGGVSLTPEMMDKAMSMWKQLTPEDKAKAIGLGAKAMMSGGNLSGKDIEKGMALLEKAWDKDQASKQNEQGAKQQQGDAPLFGKDAKNLKVENSKNPSSVSGPSPGGGKEVPTRGQGSKTR